MKLRGISRSDYLSAVAFFINVAFPIVTTPLVAYMLGSEHFSRASLIALISYVQSALIEGSATTYCLSRWGRRHSSRSVLSRIIGVVLVVQIFVGVIAAFLTGVFGVYWLRLDNLSVLIGVLAGFSPVFFPSWAMMLLGEGGVCLRAVLFSRVLALLFLVSVYHFFMHYNLVYLVAFGWLLIPAIVPGFFAIRFFSHCEFRQAVRSRRLVFALVRQLKHGVLARICVILYSTVPVTLIGRFYSYDIAGNYFFFDRLRVVGQSLIGSQYPLIGRVLASRWRVGGAVNTYIYRYLVVIAFLGSVFFALYWVLAPYVVAVMPAERGFLVANPMLLSFSAMGALVVCSNALLFLIYLPLFGQAAVSRVLLINVFLSFIFVPLGMSKMGVSGVMFSAVFVEFSLLAILMIDLVRRRR